jgi:hemoglobin-like flavoprotein
MTADERRLILDSIASVREYSGPFTLLFYGKLFELDPTAHRLFHTDLETQGRKVMDMLTSVAESLNDFAPMQSRLAELGRQHAAYGVRPEQYEILGRAMLWSLTQVLGENFDPRTREAWTKALTVICSAMQSGLV